MLVGYTRWLAAGNTVDLTRMNSRAILARNLRVLRNARSMSQEELAHRAGIDRTYVSDLERQVYAASVDMLDALASVFGLTAAKLIDEGFSSTD